MRKTLITVAACGALILGVAGPASAQDWETGSTSCATGLTVTTRSYGTQAPTHTQGTSVKTFSNIPWDHYEWYNVSKRTTSWRMDTYGNFNNTLTTAYCVS